ncbi:protein of unknown function DUF477 [[Leptolyngbya] sp. PCC 7376]|uniref:TPM domain-containing protein n=1 Tax=[Leptolyngbya] sp. PCC 7376 TaxID=111781 RepID=UPI00029F31BD|nr:TPM domain-containing protein [[Leptolyngbya] sp. PCC 7376]AFY37008.1 protein of unknown function DUF477 [[Leptolyngbya] sp. PCC 7376]
MSKFLSRNVVGLAIAATIVLPVQAVEVSKVPKPWDTGNSWVTDMGDLLTPQTEAQLNKMISELEAKNGTEIVVVAVPNTAPSATPKEFTTELFNTWGIGKAGVNNGVLFVISKGDRRVEIETGYGVEEFLPDARVGAIIDKQIIPAFKEGDFDSGVINGTKGLIKELEPAKFPLQRTISSGFEKITLFLWNKLPVIIVLGLFFSPFALVIGRIIIYLSRPLYVKPWGKTKEKDSASVSRRMHCDECRTKMRKVKPKILSESLSEPEKFAKKKHYAYINGWQCLKCSSSDEKPEQIHVFVYPGLITKRLLRKVRSPYCAY